MTGTAESSCGHFRWAHLVAPRLASWDRSTTSRPAGSSRSSCVAARLYDEVTGLPNRRLFLERLAAAIAREREDGRGYAVAFFDLDGFKLVNDSLGHLAGDRLLAEVGDRLRRRLRRSDLAARFGGDEFAILLHDIPASAVITTVADVLAEVRQPFDVDGQAIAVSASTGITTSDLGYSSPDEVMRDADLAMYRAKATQVGSALLFDESLRASGLTLSAAPGSRG